MTATAKFTVVQAHWGDKVEGDTVTRHRYEKGDTRTADPEDDRIRELVKRHIIKPAKAETKAKPAANPKAKSRAKPTAKREKPTVAKVAPAAEPEAISAPKIGDVVHD